MRNLLGFHLPRFSEEDDWLPGWLQPPSSSPLISRELDEDSNQCRRSSFGGQEGFQEELGSLQQSTRENGNMSSDDRYKSFHLFLSGEDDSGLNFPSSSSNHEVRYHLRLSTEDSQCTLNPVFSRSQSERLEFNQTLLLHQPEAKVLPEEDTHKVNCNDDETHIVPSQPKDNLGISHHESPSFKEQKEKNSSHRVDFVNAIELTIAASEALEIHEIVKHVPITESSIGLAVLEAALRVKQARLEDCIETSSSSFEESNEIDCDVLSDLDELAMADAYEDVGLTVNGHSDQSAYGSLSHVKDSYASENYIFEAKQLEVDSGFNSSKEQHKQVDNANKLLKRVHMNQTFEGNTHEGHVSYEELGTEDADLACDIDPVLSCSVKKADFCMTEVSLERDHIPGDTTSLHTILRSSVQYGISRCNEREDKMTNLVPDRFQSRWFGGWTWKNDPCIPAVKDDKCKRHIPELFANETSSISESADVAPDMNSCMQKHDNECNSVSQTSVNPECAYEKASNGGKYCPDDLPASRIVALEHSYDKARTSGNLLSDGAMSPIDPLCSVVPCSFTSNSAGHSRISQNCEQQVKFGKYLSPTAAPNFDTAKRVSPLSEGRSNSKVIGEGSPTVRRQQVSLKTYSMLDPTSSVREQTRVKSLPSENVPMYFPADMQTPTLDFRGDNDGIIETAKGDTELTSQMVKKMNLPMTKKNGNKVVLNSNVELLPTRVSRKVKSTCKGFLVPRRKRVRFSEPEISYPQVNIFKQWPEVRLEDPLVASKACRGLRSSNLQPKSGSCDKKMLFLGLEFLLTGFSVKKHNEIKNLILENGGIVFDDIPLTLRGKQSLKLPLVLCPKKLLTTKFLYGCAVNACILKVKWLFDSVGEGLILPPNKYTILKEHPSKNCNIIGKPVCRDYFIFNNVAIMLHGQHNFCNKMAKIIKYGGGLVFKTLHWLVKCLDSKKVSMGAIIVEDENHISRQLKQCALEQNIPTMPFSWIVNSLYAGRLFSSPELKLSDDPLLAELSEEI
uniref:uncharacterized protein LOC122579262 n=1 Tax=Erigeron canadensis TaxID=72917 RepID=UPI001CB8CC8C|nr:uncharacterized protein LOC122579262 [Erigeron canadensis]XP_043607325.1 uncharacterized protein LOC122579262 [Erigeron canadensis]XP_043607326.1 uncharacterized protein LOC122579262 [Erigeron canadensis]XP_043607327.1 uncharacterized protein LOC122579262 [Erigeron canadensis]